MALAVHMFLMRSALGTVLRGAGGNPKALQRAGWSMLRVKMTMFALAGFFGVLSGMALVGLTTAADANIGARYTLLSIAGAIPSYTQKAPVEQDPNVSSAPADIAGAILGGSEFVGGRVSPVGAVIGAATLLLTGSLLTFLRLNPDFQIGAQGAILIIVLALRVMLTRTETWR